MIYVWSESMIMQGGRGERMVGAKYTVATTERKD